MEVGERYIIEISDVITTSNGNIAKIKGFNALVFDENGLDKLECLSTDYIDRGKAEAEKSDACAEAQLLGRAMGHDEGYKEGYDEAKKVWYKLGYDEGLKDGAKRQETPHEPKEGDVYLSELGILNIITHKGECGYAVLWEDGSAGHYSAEKIKKWKLVSDIKVFLDKLKSEVLA